MPYINKDRRVTVQAITDEGSEFPQTAGELNYYITDALDTYLSVRGLSYTTLNEVIGVLECAKLELYRRIAAPYEDAKCAENGDVYTVRP